ncbi:hypothetical protein AB6813_12995 [bacterium RCC_150]
MSWRDTVPEASALDLENLLGTGIGAAREQLEQHGGFLPFAVVVQNDGELRLVAVAPDPVNQDADPLPASAPDRPDSAAEGLTVEFDAEAMLRDLTELLRQNREECRAAALVCDITLPEEGSDAIHVAAEHKEGSVFAAVLPYQPRPGAEWEFGELAADSNGPTIWLD